MAIWQSPKDNSRFAILKARVHAAMRLYVVLNRSRQGKIGPCILKHTFDLYCQGSTPELLSIILDHSFESSLLQNLRLLSLYFPKFDSKARK